MDASLVGPALQGAGGIFSTAAAMYEADKNRTYQYDMSSTAHQREVRDLRAAGLNPILSAGGSGATTPTGAMATPGNPMEGMTNALYQAKIQSANTQADTQNKIASNQLIDAQKRNVDQDTLTKLSQNVLNSSVNLKTLADRDVSVGQLKLQANQSAQAWQQSMLSSAQVQAQSLQNDKLRATRALYDNPLVHQGESWIKNWDPSNAIRNLFNPNRPGTHRGTTGGF